MNLITGNNFENKTTISYKEKRSRDVDRPRSGGITENGTGYSTHTREPPTNIQSTIMYILIIAYIK